MTADRARLREPFPPELIQRLPASEKRPAQDYVGHAAVTDRLNEAAPRWEFKVLERFEAGGDCWVLVRLTIDEVSRDEYGDGRDPKVAIGNALRRAAMRWGVALDLWSKAELQAVDSAAPSVAAVTVESTPTSEGDGRGSTPASTAYGEGAEPSSSDDSLDAVVKAYGSSAKAMLAARKLWPDTTSIAQLTQEQRAVLIGEAP